MEKYFNVLLEFDKKKVDEIIENAILSKQKGFICSVEGNIITIANKNSIYNSIVNSALVNICDGSSIAKFASIIHQKKFNTYIGADLFINYVKKKKYRMFFLGNTSDVLAGLKKNLSLIDNRIHSMPFVTLPFLNVEDFDYKNIADEINKIKPEIIWVSLGAPKQEIFMSKLLPFLETGVMFGFGAIFNFYANVDNQKRAPNYFLKLKLEWLYRLYSSPRKQFPRVVKYLSIIPILIIREYMNKHFNY